MSIRASVCALIGLCAAGVIPIATTPATAQTPRALSSTEIYTKVSDSVVLLEVRNRDKQPISQATAFVVESGALLTNAHAIEGGTLWVRIGPVSVPATLERADLANDLAIVRVGAEISLPALRFSAASVAPGSKVFAVGNPRGFERTITEGLLTSAREVDGRSLLQISAAISPGSSGGPIVNERGEVVGVAVGILKDSQNLNFAVPAAVAIAFLASSSAPDASNVSLVDSLMQQQTALEWSGDDDSEYQQLRRKLREAVSTTASQMKDEKTLNEFFEKVKMLESDVERPVARRAVAVAPGSAVAQYNLAWSLYQEALIDDAARAELLKEAETVAQRALPLATTNNRATLLLLGRIQALSDAHVELGLSTLAQVALNQRDDLAEEAALDLYSTNRRLKRFAAARKWFDVANGISAVAPTWRFDYAEMLEESGDASAAALTNLNAGAAPGFHARLCEAARLFSTINQMDAAISAARRCLTGATTATDGDDDAAWAHRLLSIFLRDRGVTDQAISHAKQAIAISPDDGTAFGLLAAALNAAERWSEAETAARSAIRLEDGGKGFNHFRLGIALFNQNRWSEARTSFEQSAKMDPKDAGSTYNIALCLVRLGFRSDAAKWYEETLRREPNRQDAAEIRRLIAEIRR